ncbi:DUF6344 domain-containing protein [Streptomyces sp. NPDC032472]|uniref:DUF6344 domain-containing protein n=1 Tax=Streptomyces sp. NPDC032472 TaxID=3155018 RepID=UPI00340E6CD6
MAQRITLTSLRTAVVTALMAFLAALGFRGRAATPAVAAAAPGTGPVRAAVRPAAASVRRPVARRVWRAMVLGRSLPPTIKQRIGAEAHGASPSVRRSAAPAAFAATDPVPPAAAVPSPSAAPVAAFAVVAAPAPARALGRDGVALVA